MDAIKKAHAAVDDRHGALADLAGGAAAAEENSNTRTVRRIRSARITFHEPRKEPSLATAKRSHSTGSIEPIARSCSTTDESASIARRIAEPMSIRPA